MSPATATVIALLMYAVGVLPFVWLALRPGARVVGFLVTALLVGVAIFHTGVLSRGELASTDVTGLMQSQPEEAACTQLFDVLEEADVLLSVPSADGLVVRGAMWDQLPQPLTDAVLTCAQMADPAAAGPEDVKVTRR